MKNDQIVTNAFGEEVGQFKNFHEPKYWARCSRKNLSSLWQPNLQLVAGKLELTVIDDQAREIQFFFSKEETDKLIKKLQDSLNK